MEFRINTQITSRNCKYRIDKEFTPSCYLGTAILTGELGDFESADGVLIVANQHITKKILGMSDKIAIIENLSLSGETVIILSDSNDNRNFITSYPQKHSGDPVHFGANKYQGATHDGQPHGFGTMKYGDGKIYIGNFVNGLRHGQGKLTMPDGQYFEGLFDNDIITEEGTYYDEKGNPRNIRRHGKSKSIGNIIWDKTWRLWASLACFLLAALTVWLIVEFFSSNKGGVVRVGIFIAPLAFSWWGIKNLIGFFSHLFNSQVE